MFSAATAAGLWCPARTCDELPAGHTACYRVLPVEIFPASEFFILPMKKK